MCSGFAAVYKTNDSMKIANGVDGCSDLLLSAHPQIACAVEPSVSS